MMLKCIAFAALKISFHVYLVSQLVMILVGNSQLDCFMIKVHKKWPSFFFVKKQRIVITIKCNPALIPVFQLLFYAPALN